ncbi:hypothetical protein, partial [Paenibacillus naphthalenovorans]|uniref:hypothetical protein n=1 Tax=Paenibacillus naphthalenovorans TaxID=162209 RepID=UPI003D2C346E
KGLTVTLIYQTALIIPGLLVIVSQDVEGFKNMRVIWPKIFEKDRGRSFSNKLSYTLEEANQKIHPSHSIIIAGGKGFRSLYEGTQSLNNAVRRYFEFLSHREKNWGDNVEKHGEGLGYEIVKAVINGDIIEPITFQKVRGYSR